MADVDAFEQDLARLVGACEAGADLAGVLAAAASAAAGALGADGTATYDLSEDGEALVRIAGEGPDVLEPQGADPVLRDGRAVLPLVSARRVLGCIVATEVTEPDGLGRARIVAGIAAQAAEAARLWAGAGAAGTVDVLTGLPNHLGFQSVMVRELSRAKRTGASLAVAILDLGAPVEGGTGDGLVRAVSASLAGAVRSYDCVCRLGAVRFALVLPGMASDAAAALAGRLSQTAAAAADGALTMAGGVAAFPEHAATVDELVSLAADALAGARAGGGGVAVWNAPLDHAATTAAAEQAMRSTEPAPGRSETARVVGEYAGHIAGTMGLDAAHAERIRLAAFLYETADPVGGVASRVTAGVLDADAAEWILARGRPVAEAPLETRILAVADAFVAAGGHRSDAAAGAALAELWQRAGDELDAGCVRALEVLIAS
jgi:diguanylate cyclase (GGDEF)-like protein